MKFSLIITVLSLFSAAGGDFSPCTTIDNDIERLACYDQVASAKKPSSEPELSIIQAHCLEMLQKKLKSPSSLVVQSVTTTPTSENLLKLVPTNRIAEGQSRTAPGETVMIIYDAQNSYGAMLRGNIMCDYLSPPFVDSSLSTLYARWVAMGSTGNQDFWIHPTVSLNSLTASIQLGERLRDYIEETSQATDE